ncbi:acylphosphatase [Propionispira arboris]|uniref:acylphosphatase n=1 Tax=Propionispira arboris TaxID=84035 RepID=A0A1H6W118_9FIRM|nr:acylphosphatase [Propionispira arboris]SEJ06520.1 acylphosphatase [Propionispira arboris]
MTEQKIRYFARAAGRVQGVGFRYFVQTNAMELDVTGWVRNMDDGSVTMEIQGAGEQLKKLVGRINKGSAFIKVKNMELTQIDVINQDKKFAILY